MGTSPTFTEILTKMANEGKLEKICIGKDPRKINSLLNIMSCHTEKNGFVKEICNDCGYTAIHYGSCNDSCCPQCGSRKREEWAEKQTRNVVNAPYYHIIFTVPDQDLNALFLHDPKFMYDCLLEAQAETLKEFSKKEKYLGVDKPGFFSTLHTWGSNLSLHCHVHSIFCAAGLNESGEFKIGKKDYLFPAKALAKRFKGKFFELVEKKYLNEDPFWLGYLTTAKNKEFNVEIKSFDRKPEIVILYLSRYINRVAISNGRLISYKDGIVKFRFKNYKKNGKIQEMQLTDEEFIRRFLMHIPPKGFRRTRFYGFLSNNSKQILLEVQRLSGIEDTTQIELDPIESNSDLDWFDALGEELQKQICPKCGKVGFHLLGRVRSHYQRGSFVFRLADRSFISGNNRGLSKTG